MKLILKPYAILHLNLPVQVYSTALNPVMFNDNHRIQAEELNVHKEYKNFFNKYTLNSIN